MVNKTNVNSHSILRLKERFSITEKWLIEEIENGNFVWLAGTGHNKSKEKVRHGYLLFIPEVDEYGVVVIDSRSRTVITILTEEMAKHSSWSGGITEASKLRAKELSVSIVQESNFFLERSQSNGGIIVVVCVKTYSSDWCPIILSVIKVKVFESQIDTNNNICTLNSQQIEDVRSEINNKLISNEMLAYGELFIKMTNSRKYMAVVNTINSLSTLEMGEQASRWLE